ncbi:MAG: nitroreductase family protein [Candidatus Binataceae bacterium]
MEKPAETAHPIEELLRRRWSPRAFAERPIEPEKLLRMFEAARWSASCFNEQPWSFIVATRDDEAEFARLLSCLVEGNQAWASHAPVLMVSVARLNFVQNDKPNRHAIHDVGLATAQMIVQAMAMGLFVHPMAGFHPDKVRELYGVPQGYEPVAAIAAGYPGDPATLSESLRQRELAPRLRKPQEEFVSRGRLRV